MKKVYVVFALVVSLFVGIKSASAMTEAQLKEKMFQTFTINGHEFKITDSTKVLVERYLDSYDVSEADCQYIADRIDEAINIIKASGKSKIDDLTKTQKNQLKALVEKVSANTSVKATVTKGSVVVYKPDSTNNAVFAEVTDPIKQTGLETSPVAMMASVSFLITLAGACLVVRQVKESK